MRKENLKKCAMYSISFYKPIFYETEQSQKISERLLKLMSLFAIFGSIVQKLTYNKFLRLVRWLKLV